MNGFQKIRLLTWLAAGVIIFPMCPYAMLVFATAREPGKVHVSYRRAWRADGSAASKAALQDVEKLLDSIARQAVGQK